VAVGARAAGTIVGGMLAEEHLGEGKGERKLAGTLRPAEHEGVRQLVLKEKPHEMLLHLFLSYDVSKGHLLFYHLIIYHLPFICKGTKIIWIRD
jgi:hypothetical protein